MVDCLLLRPQGEAAPSAGDSAPPISSPLRPRGVAPPAGVPAALAPLLLRAPRGDATPLRSGEGSPPLP